jgi:hypothetical protein
MPVRGILLIALLVACKGGGADSDVPADTDGADTDVVIDTSDTTDDGVSWDDTEATLAFQAAHFPPVLLFLVSIQAAGDATACPAVAHPDDTTTVLTGGGCTDGDGQTWDGTATITETDTLWAVVYDGYTVETAESSLVIDGEQSLGSAGILLTDGTMVGEADAVGAVDWAWLDHAIDAAGYFAVATHDAEGGDYSIAGTLRLDGVDLALSGGAESYGDGCATEPDRGGIGIGSADFDLDGETACDGCIPWTAGAAAGSICDWDFGLGG